MQFSLKFREGYPRVNAAMDSLFWMFLIEAVGVDFGKSLDVLTRCFTCSQEDKRHIGNQQFNGYIRYSQRAVTT